MRLTILGSGSSGNCAYLETEQVRLIVDCGFHGSEIRKRLAGIGRTPESLDGILITHEHSDHILGLSSLTARGGLPIYCSRLTEESITRTVGHRLEFRRLDSGGTIEIGDVTVESVPVPHDAVDPVGFMVRAGKASLGFLTDLGHTTRLLERKMTGVKVLVLETNYDPEMLAENENRIQFLRDRIAGRLGHLSNEAAGNFLAKLDGLETVYLAHLSRECNSFEKAASVVDEKIKVLETFQDRACEELSF